MTHKEFFWYTALARRRYSEYLAAFIQCKNEEDEARRAELRERSLQLLAAYKATTNLIDHEIEDVRQNLIDQGQEVFWETQY